MKIIIAQRGETAEYCVEELKKYVVQMSRGAILPSVERVDKLPQKAEDGILLGLLDEMGLDTSDLEDPFIEDIIDIKIENGVGYIAGSNQRSILMGIYKYCTSAGCRFLRPGAGGDLVPKADLYHHSYTYRKKADYPFRGQCIEGAVSYEHVRDTVYWLPKVGMNLYMIEGLVPYSYMHKWYGHVGNYKMRQKGQETSWRMLRDYVDLIERDVKRAGLQLHTLGHGWMFEGFGIHDDDSLQFELTDEIRKHLALVNGERGLFKNATFHTHFCYSNPESRKFLVDYMVNYIKSKPHVDYVHMWLADSVNNQCECEECQKLIPSDHYVTLLNELDAELEKIGADTRVVFIMYNETERPPQKLVLKNTRRFSMTVAIGLHYEKGYLIEPYTDPVPEFKRNQYKPAPAALRLKWHRDWKELCNNVPSFLFEYRYYTDMYCDLGHMQISRETNRDMKSIGELSFNGCMNDQTHRMFMPTSLPLITMGATLFDKSVDFEALKADYFKSAFGADAALCRNYLETLSDLLCPSNWRVGGKNGVEEAALGNVDVDKQNWINNPYVAEKAAKIPGLVEEFIPVIERNMALAQEEAQRLSWYYLRYHAEIVKRFAKLLLTGAQGDIETAKTKCYQEVMDYVSEHEMEFHPAFDGFLFGHSMRLKMGLPKVPYMD